MTKKKQIKKQIKTRYRTEMIKAKKIGIYYKQQEP